MTKTAMITKMAAAMVLASVAAGVTSNAAQAGWGSNGQYGNAPQANNAPIGPHFGGYGGNGGQRPVVVVPGPRPMQPQVVVYPRPAPPVYVPSPVVVRPVPVVVNRPVYIPTAPVVKETVVVQRPATVVASTPAPVVAAAPAPVVNNNCNCLVKEYPQAGVVVFRDICTKESATYSNLPQQTSQAVLPPTQ